MHMRELPLISIALCTYNGEKFLAQQIESLLAQDYPNFEILICDDCSTDNTLEVAASFQSARIRIQANTQNLGFNKNFERAFHLCTGELIAPCDQDDIWNPSKLSTLHAELGSNMLAYCDSALMDEFGTSINQKISDKLNMYSGKDVRPFLFINCVSGHASLFRKHLLDHACPLPSNFYYDHWLATVAASLDGIVFVDQCLVHFRQHAASCTDVAGLKTTSKKSTPNLMARTEHEAEWMERLSLLNGGASAAKLRLLWLGRKGRYFCPKLSLFLLRFGGPIFFISKKPLIKFRFAAKCFWGHKTKQLLRAKKYSSS